MSNLLDTLLNFMTFAFIGLMVWLYFKKPVSDDRESPEDRVRDA